MKKRVWLRIVCLLFVVLFFGLTGVSTSADSMTAASLKKQMDQICKEYGYESGKYWSYKKVDGDTATTNANKKSYKASSKKANTSSSDDLERPGATGWYGYTFDSGSECWGFASFIGYKLFGQKNPQNGGWTKHTKAADVRTNGVCVGDIIRTTGSPHSAIVYSISANGTIRFIECWGTRNNIIKVNNTFAGSVGNIEDLLNNGYGKFSFLAHAPNNTSTPGWNPKALELTVKGYTGVYDGKAHGISVSVSKPTSGATVKYGAKSGTYDKSKSLTYTNAGTYTVYYQAWAPGYYATTSKYKKTGSAKIVIEKADSAVETAPVGKELLYTGEQQALITAGTAVGGTMQYSLDGQTYSETLPAAADPGTYDVWYYVKGDGNHTDTEPAVVHTTLRGPIRAVVTFRVVNGAWDDGTTSDRIVTLNGYEGDTLTLAANDIPAVGSKPNDAYEPGAWNVQPRAATVISQDTTYTYTYTHVSGWEKQNGKWVYYSSEGKLVTGWKKISNKWYYFNSDGIMQTGWLKLNSKWYYLSSSGAMLTGWQTIGGKKYYLAADGSMAIGLKKVDGKWYYFETSGAQFTTAGWKKIGTKWYYFDSTGVAKTGWLKLSNKWYYLDTDASMVTGWKKISNKWYYFETSGVMLANTTKTIGGKAYTFDASGACTNP